MRSGRNLVLTSLGIAAGIYLVTRYAARRPRLGDVQITSRDLDFKQVSRQEVASEHLLDLNAAAPSDLTALGLDQDAVARVIENRPYRSKLELVSRMVIPEQIYVGIRDKVAVAEARDPVKVA
jgi:hypothetical protein